ncbi:Uncharacterised protein [Clostridioides difficile]|nr:hypothetical protein V440_11865 [Clostridioides difficile]SJN88788.1 Uncharacterised protein [Clostridioides difficile]SJO92943.1 Uncharacterised protein [Clostridioides difficile]SJO93686.1 Uncharacterised protein [Clostridioides difficile]SJO93755.1 Uncharacterised protein [Clostridioides difficile]
MIKVSLCVICSKYKVHIVIKQKFYINEEKNIK